MKTIAFFNNKGGVGKTSLVYHLSWMFAELGVKVVAADLDPQANLTSMFLKEDRLEEIWPDGDHPKTIFGAIHPIIKGTGDIAHPSVESVADNIWLIPGDLWLSTFEEKLSYEWGQCNDRKEGAFRVISSFYRIMEYAANECEADVVLIDVGPNLGAINRAAIIASNYVTIPLAPDLFSLQGLKNLGPTLREWREGWKERLEKRPPELNLPTGDMSPVGYVVMQHAMRADRPVKAYQRWMDRIPLIYRASVLNQSDGKAPLISSDNQCLSLLKHYRSLMPLAMEAGKPMFSLKPADGAIGSHVNAVEDCFKDFRILAKAILDKCAISYPDQS